MELMCLLSVINMLSHIVMHFLFRRNTVFITGDLFNTGFLMLTSKVQVYFAQKSKPHCYEFTHAYVDYFFSVYINK